MKILNLAAFALLLAIGCGDSAAPSSGTSGQEDSSTTTSTLGTASSSESSDSSSGSESESSSGGSESTGGVWPEVPQEPRHAFVTSGNFLGTEIGGYFGGIAICNDEAALADLPGHYQPWLGGDLMTPALWGSQDYAFVAEYRLPITDELVTNEGWLGLAGGVDLASAIYRNARGEVVPAPFLAWTNTDPEGFTLSLESTCANWGAGDAALASQGAVGDIASKTATWAYLGERSCAGAARLYCVETTIPWWETADHP